MEMGNLNDMIGNAIDSASGTLMSGSTASLAVAVVIGLLVCFFGLKLVKILTAVAGAAIGAGIGAAIGAAIGMTDIPFLIAVIGCAIVLGALAFFLYKFGVFLMVLAYVFGLCAVLFPPTGTVFLIIDIVVAVIFAVLAVIYIEPLVIIVTGFSGGESAGLAAAELTGLTAYAWAGPLIGLVIAFIGIGVQFMMHSRKIGKTETVHARKYKEQVSRESEVEKARMILEDDEKEDEDD